MPRSNRPKNDESPAVAGLVRGAGATGLEPATSGVTGRRSNQLSYAPRARGNSSALPPGPSRGVPAPNRNLAVRAGFTVASTDLSPEVGHVQCSGKALHLAGGGGDCHRTDRNGAGEADRRDAGERQHPGVAAGGNKPRPGRGGPGG